MATAAPGKAHRNGIDMMTLAEMFATEDKAQQWFEAWMWPDGNLSCLKCGSSDGAYRVKSGKPMPYRCRDCRSYFSLKTGTAMEKSPLPLRVWGWAIFLEMTSLKGVSSMKLHRDLGVTQKTAWFMLHRIREAFAEVASVFEGPVEVDECYVGGLEKNKHASKRLHERHREGKTAVVGLRDRATNRVAAEVIDRTDGDTLRGFVEKHASPDATLYTDDASTYKGTARDHQTVKHSVGEYVRGMAHTNGVESFWATLKRAHKGVYHKLSPKHLQRYVSQFAGKKNVRELDTLAQLQAVVMGMVGRRLMYKDLIAE